MHENERIGRFVPLFKDLYRSAKDKLGFTPEVSICIKIDKNNAENPLGKTAHYSPSDHKIALYTQGRHIKDILRSLAHELVHHNQNCRGDFDGGVATVSGYAQEDGHLREMEREAYEVGNLIFRDWEDNLKKKGGRPLFTSTHYTQPIATSDVVAAIVGEGKKMKKNINESRLRDIIQGVIKEMFDDDLNEEDNMGMPPDVEDPDSAIVTTEQEQQITEDSGESESWNDWKNEHADDDHIKEMKHHLRALEGDRDYERKDAEYDHDDYEDDRKDESKQKTLNEDSGEEEAWHDWMNEHADDDHIKEIEHHLRSLKEDRDYDRKGAEYDHDKYEDEGYDEPSETEEETEEEAEEEVEQFTESFFPKGRSIREKARLELNEALMKRWAKSIK